MITRCLLALFLALTGVMVVAAPATTMAMSGGMLCQQRVVHSAQRAETPQVSAVVDHALHGTDHGAQKVAEISDVSSLVSTPVCCDHACGVELTLLPVTDGSEQVASNAAKDLSSSGLTELTHPNGLRRPPKA